MVEGDAGWVIQSVLSLAFSSTMAKEHSQFCRCTSVTFTPRRCHRKEANPYDSCSDARREAGDFNGASGRRTTWASAFSIIEEAFAGCDLPLLPGLPPLSVPGTVLGTWSDVCGFIKHPDSHKLWRVRQHNAFSILHEALGIWQTDQRCHHEVWLHLDFVEQRCSQSHHVRHDQRILLKERSAPYHYSEQKGHISDHSLSSL